MSFLCLSVILLAFASEQCTAETITNPKGDVIVFVYMQASYCRNEFKAVEDDLAFHKAWPSVKSFQLALANTTNVRLRPWRGHTFPEGARVAFITSWSELLQQPVSLEGAKKPEEPEVVGYNAVMNSGKLSFDELVKRYDWFCSGGGGPLFRFDKGLENEEGRLKELWREFREPTQEGNTIIALLPGATRDLLADDGEKQRYLGSYYGKMNLTLQNYYDVHNASFFPARILLALMNSIAAPVYPTWKPWNLDLEKPFDFDTDLKSTDDDAEAIAEVMNYCAAKHWNVASKFSEEFAFLRVWDRNRWARVPNEGRNETYYHQPCYVRGDFIVGRHLLQFPQAVNDALYHEINFRDCVYEVSEFQFSAEELAAEKIDAAFLCTMAGGQCVKQANVTILELPEPPYGKECPESVMLPCKGTEADACKPVYAKPDEYE